MKDKMSFLTYSKWLWVVQTFQEKRKTHTGVTIYLSCDAHCTHTKDAKMTKDRLLWRLPQQLTIMWMWSPLKIGWSLCWRPICPTESVFGSTSTVNLGPTSNSGVICSFSVHEFSLPQVLCRHRTTTTRCPTLDVTFKSPLPSYISVGIYVSSLSRTSLSQLVIRRLCPYVFLLYIPTRLTTTICQPFSLTDVWHVCGEYLATYTLSTWFSMPLKARLFHVKLRYLCLSECYLIHLTQLLEARIFSSIFSLTGQLVFFLALGELEHLTWLGATGYPSVVHHSITDHCVVSNKLNLNGKPASTEQ